MPFPSLSRRRWLKTLAGATLLGFSGLTLAASDALKIGTTAAFAPPLEVAAAEAAKEASRSIWSNSATGSRRTPPWPTATTTPTTSSTSPSWRTPGRKAATTWCRWRPAC